MYSRVNHLFKFVNLSQHQIGDHEYEWYCSCTLPEYISFDQLTDFLGSIGCYGFDAVEVFRCVNFVCKDETPATVYLLLLDWCAKMYADAAMKALANQILAKPEQP